MSRYGDVEMELVIEITEWTEVDFEMPGHAYVLDDDGRCIGYFPEGSEDFSKFTNPLSFSKSRRKFHKVDVPQEYLEMLK